MNKVFLIGSLGQDPKIFNGGVSSCSLAMNENYKKGEEWVEKTTWVNIKSFKEGKMNGLSKGDMVFLEGKLSTNKYESKEGKTSYSTDIEILNIKKIAKGEKVEPVKEEEIDNKLPF